MPLAKRQKHTNCFISGCNSSVHEVTKLVGKQSLVVCQKGATGELNAQTVALNPGFPFRILSRSFGEKSEGKPWRIAHVIRWHRDVGSTGCKRDTSLEKTRVGRPAVRAQVWLVLSTRLYRFRECCRPYHWRCKFKTTELPGVCRGNELVISQV